MSGMNFNTSNSSFRQLMGNGISYIVPKFQRDYSWSEEEWDDLWQDILEVCKSEKDGAHYMGYLVFQSEDNKNFDVIDGQQRITTLSILILAVLKNLQILQSKNINSDENKQREEELRRAYIGYLNPATLISKSKLQLNKQNDLFYQNYLVPLENIPTRGLNFSEKLMKKGFEWFVEKIKKEISDNSGKKLAEFVGSFTDKLFFTVITVTDELNAFKVFETLNARGVKLSATDLLKNYLFSVICHKNLHQIEIKRIEKLWERIVKTLGSQSFPEFLRIYWNSRNKLVRKTDLFKTIKKNIKDKETAFDLIRKLDENADFYAALGNSEDELWEPEQKKYIERLKMFGVRQPYSLLMIANKKFDKDNFNQLLRACAVISFRYNVICRLHTGEQEKSYNKTAFEIAKGNLNTAKEAKLILKSCYPDDNIFQQAFKNKELTVTGPRNKKIVRYILFELEKNISNTAYDSESPKYSIEHILPQSPGENWQDYDENNDYRFINRLGNYTLLTKKKNSELGDKSYSDKKKVYAESKFQITKKISENNDAWNPNRIETRQASLSKRAKSIWRLNFNDKPKGKN